MNTSSKAGISSEVKISLSFHRWNVIITRGIVLQHSVFFFVLFPAVFLLLLEVRAFEADRFAGLYKSLVEVRRGSSSSCHRCLCPVPHLLYALWCHQYWWQRLTIAGMANRIRWHVRLQDTKNLDLQNSTPPNRFGCISKVSWVI